MSEGLERLERRITQVRQATLICGASLAVVAALLGGQLAVEIAGLLSASHRLGWEAARRQRLSSALARLPQGEETLPSRASGIPRLCLPVGKGNAFPEGLGVPTASQRDWEEQRLPRGTGAAPAQGAQGLPQTWPTDGIGERLTPDATFVALAGHVGALARRTGSTLRTLKRAEVETQDDELRPPTGEAGVGAQLQLDTTYWSGLRFLRALDGLPLPVTPTQVDLENLFPASPGREPRLALRLELLACGMNSKRLVLRSDGSGLRRVAGD
jgi:hypothetical protein